MTEIRYVTGDATQPVGDGMKIIAHVCNNVGGWGRGFVVALSRRWPEPERAYRAWAAKGLFDVENGPFCLGAVQSVQVERDIWIANMVAQAGIRHNPTAPPAVHYEGLREALRSVGYAARFTRSSVHMPRIGCGLGGGRWDRVEPIIREELCDRGVSATVYDLPDA